DIHKFLIFLCIGSHMDCQFRKLGTYLTVTLLHNIENGAELPAKLLQLTAEVIARLGLLGKCPQHISTLFLEVIYFTRKCSVLQACRLDQPFFDSNQTLVFISGISRLSPGSNTYSFPGNSSFIRQS